MARAVDVRLDLTVIDRMAKETPQKAGVALRGIAYAMLGDIVTSFGESVSSPGDPPGVDTGALRASMRAEKQEAFHWRIQDGVEYGVFLEYGTERMAARPFVTPVFEQWRAQELARFIRESDLFR